MHHFLRVVWQLLRPRTLALIYIQLALLVVVLGWQPEAFQIVLMVVILALWYAHAVAINDISDVETDSINLKSSMLHHDRPLVNLSSDTRQLWAISWVLSATLLICGLMLGWIVAVVCLAIVLLNFVYSLPPARLSGRGAVAQLVLPLGYVAFPALVVAATSERADVGYWIFVAGLYLLFAGRLFLKDIRDEVGDRRTHKLTYLVRHGHGANLLCAGGFMIGGIAIMAGSLSGVAYSIMAFAIASCIAICYVLWLMYRQDSLDRRLVYVAMAGRVASAWTFVCVIWFALHSYPQTGQVNPAWFVLVVAVLFGMGLYQLYEELLKVPQQKTSK